MPQKIFVISKAFIGMLKSSFIFGTGFLVIDLLVDISHSTVMLETYGIEGMQCKRDHGKGLRKCISHYYEYRSGSARALGGGAGQLWLTMD